MRQKSDTYQAFIRGQQNRDASIDLADGEGDEHHGGWLRRWCKRNLFARHSGTGSIARLRGGIRIGDLRKMRTTALREARSKTPGEERRAVLFVEKAERGRVDGGGALQKETRGKLATPRCLILPAIDNSSKIQ